MIHRLIAPLVPTFRSSHFRSGVFAAAVVVFHVGQAIAQGAFPAPLPGKAGTVNDPAFPPVNGAAPAPSFGGAPAPGSPFAAPPTQAGPPDECMKQFLPLRQEAERRGKLLKAASEKHSGPDVACKLIGGFVESEVKMIKYIEANAARCGIPPQISEQLKNGHKNTEVTKAKICAAAQQVQNQAPAGPSLSDVLGSAATLPEATAAKKSGGTTFDTLSGNALVR